MKARLIVAAAALWLVASSALAQGQSPGASFYQTGGGCVFGSSIGNCLQGGAAITNVPSIAMQAGGSISAASGSGLTLNLGGNGTNLLISGTGGTGTVAQFNAVTGGNTAVINARTTFQKPGTFINLGTVTWTAGAWTTNNTIFSASADLTGTATSLGDGTFPFGRYLINSDDAAIGVGKEGIGFYVQHQFGGANMTGDRVGTSTHIRQTAKSGNKTAGNNPNYVATEARSEMTVDEGGTGLTVATANGHNFGGNDIAIISGTVVNLYANNGREIDIQNTAGTTVMKSAGLQIVHLSPHAVAGSLSDAGLLFGDQVGAIGWNGSLIQAGVVDGQDPFGSAAGFIEWVISSNPAAHAPAATDGINIGLGTLSGKAFGSRGFSVGGTGIISDYTAQIAQTASGVSIDLLLQQGSAPTISAAGSGNAVAGDWYTDNLSPQPGLYSADSVSGGGVTAITMQRAPYSSTQPATVVVANLNGNDGGTWTVGLTWTAKNTLALNPSGGTVTVPTPSAGDNTTKAASTAFVATSFAPLASPTLTGTPAAPTPAAADNSTKIATTAFVETNAYGAKVSTLTAAASASLTWTGLTGAEYKVRCSNLLPATATANIWIQVGEGGTPTWEVASYAWGSRGWTSGGGSLQINSASDSGVSIANGATMAWAAGYGLSGEYNVHNLTSTSAFKQIEGNGNFQINGTANAAQLAVAGTYTGDQGAITAIRMIASTGNLTSGSCTLYVVN